MELPLRACRRVRRRPSGLRSLLIDAERLLISKVVETGDLRPLLETKFTSEFFADEENREAFDWLREKWAEHGKVPGAKAFKSNFPTYKLQRGAESYEYYLEEVRYRREFALTFETLAEASEALEDDDAKRAKDLLASGLLRLDTEITELKDTNLIETWEQRLETYEEWKHFGDKLRGIPSGFPTIDGALRGFQEEQLITFIGVPAAGKSTMLMRMAVEAHRAGRMPLFIGFEMSNEEQEARHDAMVAGVSYGRLLKGALTRDEEETLAKKLKSMRSSHPFVLSSDPDGATVSGVGAKIEQYRPDIVFIDGVYMMDDEADPPQPKGSPQALTNITRSLKRLARRSEIPIVISTQVLLWKVNKRRGVDMNSVGYSSSFAQDSDVILAVEHTEDESEPIKKVSVVKARSAPLRSVLISWDWDTATFSELSEEEAQGGWGVESEEEPEPEKKTKKIVRRNNAG